MRQLRLLLWLCLAHAAVAACGLSAIGTGPSESGALTEDASLSASDGATNNAEASVTVDGGLADGAPVNGGDAASQNPDGGVHCGAATCAPGAACCLSSQTCVPASTAAMSGQCAGAVLACDGVAGCAGQCCPKYDPGGSNPLLTVQCGSCKQSLCDPAAPSCPPQVGDTKYTCTKKAGGALNGYWTCVCSGSQC